MIKIRDLTFYYGDASRPALQDVNLDIEDGEFVLVTGPSGCGKTSLCRCLNGLIPHFYGGEIAGGLEVQGLDVMRHTTRDLATRVGMVFQDPENQLVSMDVQREVAFGLENLAFPRDVMAKRVEEALDTLGISGLRHRQVHELSGGEKQKVVISSVLALHPDILVLDEPTSELDPKGAEDVLSIVRRLNDELGITVILVEHRLDRVVHLVDRMIVMDKGKIIADGNPRAVLSNGDITSIGAGVPPIVRIVQRLRDNGVNVDDIPLTVKEGRSMLKDIFMGARGGTLSHTESADNGRPVIEIDKLWHAYPEGITALKNVNLRICEGEFVAVMGRNASGKTTLVKHINGLLKPTKGKVIVNGIDTRKATIAQLSRKVGFIFQNPNDHIFADTVEEEIAFILKNLGFDSGEIAARIDEMLEMFALKEFRKRYPRSLSGGERQRVAMASVLVARPRVLILDEPTRGMDYRLKSELMRFLNGYREKGNTVVLVTHDVETVAEHADRVVLLSEGGVVVDGNKRDVLSRALFFSPQINRLVQAFEKYGVPNNILTVDEALDILK
ncbi:MAG: energy-coupling factor transporter ATPase [Dehalococcoidia bacterium]|nr:energy-coupling factor transporter ATPase [Dehalococcoidia bacterium]